MSGFTQPIIRFQTAYMHPGQISDVVMTLTPLSLLSCVLFIPHFRTLISSQCGVVMVSNLSAEYLLYNRLKSGTWNKEKVKFGQLTL